MAALRSQPSTPPVSTVSSQVENRSVRRRPVKGPSCKCAESGRSPETCDHALKRCFRCHQSGHLIAQCPQPRNQLVTSSAQQAQGRHPPSQGSAVPGLSVSEEHPSLPLTASVQITPQVCPFCGQPGHYMAACPQFAEYMRAMIQLHKLN